MANPINLEAFGTATPHRYAKLDQQGQLTSWIVLGLLWVALLVSYFNTLANVAGFWDQPQYSHGWIIPIGAAVLLWLRRESFTEVPAWHRWVGLAILVAGILMRVAGAMTTTFSLDNISFIPCLIGTTVMVGGLPTLRWAGPAIAFLIFMYPLPGFLQRAITQPLQRLGAICSSYALVTCGADAYREGNEIRLGISEEAMNVAEQCSGLRMLTIFGGLAVAMALLSRSRPWWERGLIVLSAIPIALIVNVIRITLTGLLFNLGFDSALLHEIFHDAPGLIMMPIAIALLYLEMKILSNIVIETDEATPVKLG